MFRRPVETIDKGIRIPRDGLHPEPVPGFPLVRAECRPARSDGGPVFKAEGVIALFGKDGPEFPVEPVSLRVAEILVQRRGEAFRMIDENIACWNCTVRFHGKAFPFAMR